MSLSWVITVLLLTLGTQVVVVAPLLLIVGFIQHWRQTSYLVTPRIKNVCAYYALSRICESMITKSGQYVALASRFRFEAESLLATTTVEIDVNGDGFGEVPINFSSTNTLWA